MVTPRYMIGLDPDVAAKKFAASIGITPWKLLAGPMTFSDSLEGFENLLTWLHRYHCIPDDTVFCMPAAGFKGEPLAYFLAARGYSIAIEPFVKVKRALPQRAQDKLDSEYMSRYAYRFLNELRWWDPPAKVLAQIKVLLSGCDGNGSVQGTYENRMEARAQIRAIDEQMRRMLKPAPSITTDWPCY